MTRGPSEVKRFHQGALNPTSKNPGTFETMRKRQEEIRLRKKDGQNEQTPLQKAIEKRSEN